ncbi:hypothetical protein ACFLT2_10395 [Acidobacteriota bacterium]
MKLKKEHLPNLFDQYVVEENRVTNALLQTLAASSRMTEGFLSKFIPEISPRGVVTIELSEQGIPRDSRPDAPKLQEAKESVPDGCFILRRQDNFVSCVVVIESKIKKGSAKKHQLRRHLLKARRRFQIDDIWALLITPDNEDPFPDWSPDEGSYKWISWRNIYGFSNKEIRQGTESAARILIENLKEYIEMKELAGFQGIDFSEGYETDKARRILGTLMQDIKDDVLKTYPDLGKQKGNISDPWDVFAPADNRNFTEGIHFTLGITEKNLDVLLTVPNRCLSGWARLKYVMDVEQTKLESILSALRQKLPNLILQFQQRHFKARRFGFMDGLILVDLDTTKFAREKRGHTKVKQNPQLFEVFVSTIREAPNTINKEVNFITKFFYNDPDHKLAIKQTEFSKTVITALAAFKPLYDYLIQ